MTAIEIVRQVRDDVGQDAYHKSLDDCIQDDCNYRGGCSDARERVALLDRALSLMEADAAFLEAAERLASEVESSGWHIGGETPERFGSAYRARLKAQGGDRG